MSQPDHSVVQQLIREEVQRLVADSSDPPGLLRAGPLADLIGRAYPNSGMTNDEIADEISRIAIQSGTPLELRRRAAA